MNSNIDIKQHDVNTYIVTEEPLGEGDYPMFVEKDEEGFFIEALGSEGDDEASVYLSHKEAEVLRDLLIKMYPIN